MCLQSAIQRHVNPATSEASEARPPTRRLFKRRVTGAFRKVTAIHVLRQSASAQQRIRRPFGHGHQPQCPRPRPTTPSATCHRGSSGHPRATLDSQTRRPAQKKAAVT